MVNSSLLHDVTNAVTGTADNSFVERCAEFIEENAEECVRTESFLRLPKEALVRLLSSDQVF